jgi:hypothetical protein
LWAERNELYVGHSNGRLTVIDLEEHSQPICKL